MISLKKAEILSQVPKDNKQAKKIKKFFYWKNKNKTLINQK